jgi:prepilin-type processing-associated H-X9-DG protein
VWTALGLKYPGDEGVKSVLTVNRRATLAAVWDGLSNTLMFGESGARNEGWSGGKQYDPSLGTAGAWGQETNNITCAGTRAPVTPGVAPAGKATTIAHVNAGVVAINAWNVSELYSFHPGTCNVVMGDGSVRSLRDDVNLATLQKLAARADGYALDAE